MDFSLYPAALMLTLVILAALSSMEQSGDAPTREAIALLRLTFHLRCAAEQLACSTAQWQS